jgi:hypothetical protein
MSINTGANNMAVSTDHGLTWTAATFPVAASDVTYGNGIFVGAGNADGSFYTSPDGITWTQRSGAVGAYNGAITFGNGVFVAVGKNGSSWAQTSPDGINWTARSLPVATEWQGVEYISGGTFIAVSILGASTSQIAKSTDNGATWTGIISTAGANAPASIATDGSMVVVTSSGVSAWYSADGGTSWFGANDNSLGNNQFGLTYGNGKFVTPSGYGSSPYFATYS